MISRLIVALTLLLPLAAHAQVQQSGAVTPGHPAKWLTNGVVGDAGPATNGTLTGIGVQNSGLGICQNNLPITSNYAQICFGYSGGVPTIFTSGPSAGAVMHFNVNGTVYSLPGSFGGDVSSAGTPVSGQIAQWTGPSTIEGIPVTGSGSAVLATSPTITTPTFTGTTTTAGISDSGGINTTAASGYSINGLNALSISNQPSNTSLIVGPGAGASLPANSSFQTFVGFQAGNAFTASGGEDTCVGSSACPLLVSGTFDTAIGQHSMGYEVSANSSTAIGNDDQRNYVSSGGNTSVGKSAMAVGGGVNNTALGTQALAGNSTTVTVGGTATAGDTISLTFTGSFTGSPATTTPITITLGETTTQMATALLTAIRANSTLNSVMGTGSQTSANQLSLFWEGTCTTGQSIVTTSSITGSATETIGSTCGPTGDNNIAIGQQAIYGVYGLSTGAYNIGIGQNTLNNLVSGNFSVAIGTGALFSLTTAGSAIGIGTNAGAGLTTNAGVYVGSNAGQYPGGANNVGVGLDALQGTSGSTAQNDVAIGYLALQAATSAQQDVAVGVQAGTLCTSCQHDTILGYQAALQATTASNSTIIGAGIGRTTYQSGAGVILIGSGAQTVDTAAAGTVNYINFENIWTVTGTDVPSTSASTLAGSLNVIGTIYQNGSPVIGGSSIVYGVRQDTSYTPAAGGTGYNPGDTMTLNDGCATHAILVANVNQAASSALTAFNIGQSGSCSNIPANPVSVLSTSGSGSGATFNLSWAPLAAGLTQITALLQNGGNFAIGGAQTTQFQGTESMFIGYRACAECGSGNFNFIAGHDAFGSGSNACGGVPILVSSIVAIGTDAMRNTCGSNETIAIGEGAEQNFTQISSATNDYGWGNVVVGTHAMFYWNGTVGFPYITAIGDNACDGVSGTANFALGTCLGASTGVALTTAQYFLEIGGAKGRVGNNTFASGQGVTLIGNGYTAVDTPAAGTNYYTDIDNIWIATGTNTPSTSISMMAGAFQIGSTTAATLSGGEFGLTKISASGTAPGAGNLKLAAVAGTTGGTCKIIAYAGTSTTPVTVVDNVGSGC